MLVPILGAFTVIAAGSDDEVVRLACYGTGTFQDRTVVSGTTRDQAGNSQSGQAVINQRGQLAGADVTVEFSSDGGRIRMPAEMEPDMSFGRENGWRDLDQYTLTSERIGGRFTINMLNKPRVEISRLDGQISVRGRFNYSFSGVCDPVERPTEPRF